ncbi:glycosyltransferase family 4 protein [Methylocaldum szegediense]|uniref:Glycosyltransferase involved in cell wall biosynthesis n=1 Tax=Methylocaldum szegediense TaxID=73780 RepID=A0ABN8X3D1_9GAMM|nr:glycosyltransferase family 1 protein [Methylocaldum szegediense]CAI8793488.1 Glycosyltransferase involved in cell wall biosynthesis [Methylocaldum szegediense]
MRILVISDAWHPQINGVVTTLTNTRRALENSGHTVEIITPDRFRTWPCPGYPAVRLAFLCGPCLRPLIEAFRPDAIHIVTEGPVGFAARRYCREKGYAYTTSYHSHFHEYLKLRAGIPLSVSWTYLRWFHCRSHRIMVATDSLEQELASKGFRRLVRWSRGVDTELFRPWGKTFLDDQRPIFLYAGRVAVEKNVEDFLRLDLPGTRYVVGDGPQRRELETKYPNVRFVGYQTGEALARHMAAAGVMVFPSRTDTFGLVMLEALACGVPVAAYPVRATRDVIIDGRVGILDNDLRQAALKALSLDPQECRQYAQQFSWEACSRQFVENLVPMRMRTD